MGGDIPHNDGIEKGYLSFHVLDKVRIVHYLRNDILVFPDAHLLHQVEVIPLTVGEEKSSRREDGTVSL